MAVGIQGNRGYTAVQRDGQTVLIDRATGQQSVVRGSSSGSSGSSSGSSSSSGSGKSYVVGNAITYKDPVTGKILKINPASAGGYMDAYNQYASDKTASKNLYEQQFNTNTANLKNTLASNNATTNSNYDNSARQAYVQYMQRQRALPSQLQALGVNGGATESGLLNLYNNYGSSHAANEQQRNADLTANQQAYEDAYNKLVSDRNQYLIDYNNDLAAQRQTAINNQINQYNNDITQFSASIAHYPTTQKGYEAYGKEIQALKKSKDPLKDIKIALLMQQRSTQFPNGKPAGSSSGGSSGGGGSRRRSYGGGRSYSSGSSSSSSSSSNSSSSSSNRSSTRSDNSVGNYYSTGNGGNNARKKTNSSRRITRPWGYAQ